MINFNNVGLPSEEAVRNALINLRAQYGLAAGWRASQILGEEGQEDVYVVGNPKFREAFKRFYEHCQGFLLTKEGFPVQNPDWGKLLPNTFWSRLKWVLGIYR
jgi:hypothetical protein